MLLVKTSAIAVVGVSACYEYSGVSTVFHLADSGRCRYNRGGSSREDERVQGGSVDTEAMDPRIVLPYTCRAMQVQAQGRGDAESGNEVNVRWRRIVIGFRRRYA